jgi:hypothetical protein
MDTDTVMTSGFTINASVVTNPRRLKQSNPTGIAATPAKGHPQTTAATQYAHAARCCCFRVCASAHVTHTPANALGKKLVLDTKHPADQARDARVTDPAKGCVSATLDARNASASAEATAKKRRTA